MNMQQREVTQVTRPVAPPINLDNGRLDIVRAALAGAFVVGALLVTLAGLWLASLAWGAYPRNNLGVGLGLAVALVGLTFGSVVLYVSVSEWLDHRARVADWHKVALYNYRQSGTEIVQHVSEWELSIDNPAHVLVAALTVHLRIDEGVDTPFSNRKLYGPVFMAGKRVGELSKHNSERMAQKFAQLGLIAGRNDRRAGAWLPRSSDDVISLVLKNWR